MKLIHKTKKEKKIIALSLSLFLVLIIVFIGLFLYESPYKKNTINSSDVSFRTFIQGFFSGIRSSVDSFSEPIDGIFTDLNTQ